jgi:hypothetical protein
MLSCPPDLQSLARLFWHEEMASSVRHHVRNKLSSIRNSAFYLRKKVEETSLPQQDPRVPQFFDLIDTELEGCAAALTMQLPPVGQNAPLDLLALTAGLVKRLTFPPETSVELMAGESPPAEGDLSELELALFFVFEYAVSRKAGSLRVSAGRPTEQEALLELSGLLLPGPSTPGLRVSKRIASRWGGRLEEERNGSGEWQATLYLPRRVTPP